MTVDVPKGPMIAVFIEQGAKRCFARALGWPGWCRAGKTEAAALEELRAYAPRYALVAGRAGIPFDPYAELAVTERVPGTSTTDFGAPGIQGEEDRRALSGDELERWIALLRAAWSILDETASRSSETLRKGPRGGGRDRTRMLIHVLEAERGYSSKLRLRWKSVDPGDTEAIAANRSAVCDALRRAGDCPQGTSWSIRYWIHRAAWHVLDHAWEMEDKQPEQASS
jgi:hypothetical protein